RGLLGVVVEPEVGGDRRHGSLLVVAGVVAAGVVAADAASSMRRARPPNVIASPQSSGGGGPARLRVCLGCRGSLGATRSRRPVPSMSSQPCEVWRSWSWGQSGSMLRRSVHWTWAYGSRWSSWVQVWVQAMLVHWGCDHIRAIFCAALGPRPR